MCIRDRVDYVLGLAKNSRLKQAIAEELAEAQRAYESTGGPARVFRDFRYQTLESWSTERRVVGKAEYLAKGENPRFIVTSLSRQDQDARGLYEDLYCARGEMENRYPRNSSSLCSPIAPAPRRCAPINCGCTSPRLPMCSLRPCERWGLGGPS